MAEDDVKDPISVEESGLFEFLCEVVEQDAVALLRCEYDGRKAATIVAISQAGDTYAMRPLALLVDEEMMDRLTFEGQPLTQEEPIEVTP